MNDTENIDDFDEDLKDEKVKLKEIGKKKDLVRVKESSAKVN
jgi:hypothetical protein